MSEHLHAVYRLLLRSARNPRLRLAQVLWLCGLCWPVNMAVGVVLAHHFFPFVPALWKLVPISAPVLFAASAYVNPFLKTTQDMIRHAMLSLALSVLMIPTLFVASITLCVWGFLLAPM